MDRFQTRRDKLRTRLRKEGLSALLITNFRNVTYLTGFTGDDSWLVVGPREEVLITDFRYVTQLEYECPALRTYVRKTGVGMTDAASRVVRSLHPERLGVEGQSMTVSAHAQLAGKLPKVELVTTAGLVEELRQIKDQDEIAAIRQAVAFAQQAFTFARSWLRPQYTEKQVADELEHQMRLAGAEDCAFPSIVAAGPRAALPHARPTDRPIGESPLLLIDWGARARLYRSDLTRLLVTARIPPKLERVYGVVLKAHAQAVASIRPGVPCQRVDEAARGVIAAAGFGRRFGHSVGHGVGLDIHELPRLAAKNTQTLRPGMIVTVEPGIYLPGVGGVRLEDDVLVTRTGHEVLSNLPRSFADAFLG